jgi:hypothetical protein
MLNRDPKTDRQTGNKGLIREFKGAHEIKEVQRALAEIVSLRGR